MVVAGSDMLTFFMNQVLVTQRTREAMPRITHISRPISKSKQLRGLLLTSVTQIYDELWLSTCCGLASTLQIVLGLEDCINLTMNRDVHKKRKEIINNFILFLFIY